MTVIKYPIIVVYSLQWHSKTDEFIIFNTKIYFSLLCTCISITTYQTTGKGELFTGLDSAVNVALHKPAFQSGTYTDAVAGRAVDGITQPQYDKTEGGCATTEGRTNEEWWMVNLEKPYAIINITIFNRYGSCKGSFSA